MLQVSLVTKMFERRSVASDEDLQLLTLSFMDETFHFVVIELKNQRALEMNDYLKVIKLNDYSLFYYCAVNTLYFLYLCWWENRMPSYSARKKIVREPFQKSQMLLVSLVILKPKK